MSQLVVNCMDDVLAGVREMRRGARRRVRSCVWEYAEGMDPGAPDEARTMPYCRRDELAGLWREAGLHDVRAGELVAEAGHRDVDDWGSPFPTGLAPSAAWCAGLDVASYAAPGEACVRRLGSPPGPFRLRARLVRARRGVS